MLGAAADTIQGPRAQDPDSTLRLSFCVRSLIVMIFHISQSDDLRKELLSLHQMKSSTDPLRADKIWSPSLGVRPRLSTLWGLEDLQSPNSGVCRHLERGLSVLPSRVPTQVAGFRFTSKWAPFCARQTLTWLCCPRGRHPLLCGCEDVGLGQATGFWNCPKSQHQDQELEGGVRLVGGLPCKAKRHVHVAFTTAPPKGAQPEQLSLQGPRVLKHQDLKVACC